MTTSARARFGFGGAIHGVENPCKEQEEENDKKVSKRVISCPEMLYLGNGIGDDIVGGIEDSVEGRNGFILDFFGKGVTPQLMGAVVLRINASPTMMGIHRVGPPLKC